MDMDITTCSSPNDPNIFSQKQTPLWKVGGEIKLPWKFFSFVAPLSSQKHWHQDFSQRQKWNENNNHPSSESTKICHICWCYCLYKFLFRFCFSLLSNVLTSGLLPNTEVIGTSESLPKSCQYFRYSIVVGVLVSAQFISFGEDYMQGVLTPPPPPLKMSLDCPPIS